MRLLALLGRYALPAMGAGVFIGLLWPQLASVARPLLVPAVVMLMTATMLRLDWQLVGKRLRRPVLPVVTLVWLLIAAPVAITLLAAVLPISENLRIALILTAAAAPLVSSVTFVIFMRLDGPLALVIVVSATLLLPLTLPPLAVALTGIEIEIGIAGFMARLGAIIGGAFVLAVIVRKLAGLKRVESWAPQLDGLNVIMMITFAVAIMDGVTEALLDRPGLVLWTTAATFILNAGMQVVGFLLFLPAGRQNALTIGLCSGYRNMGVVMAALAGQAPFEVLLFFAVGQFPIYLLPWALSPVYRRLGAGREPPAGPPAQTPV